MTDNVHTAILMLNHILLYPGFSILKSPEALFVGMRYIEIFVFCLEWLQCLLLIF